MKPDCPVFDHLLLVQRDPHEVLRYRLFLAQQLLEGSGHSGISELAVEHEADGSCCRREPWRETVAGLLGDGEVEIVEV